MNAGNRLPWCMQLNQTSFTVMPHGHPTVCRRNHACMPPPVAAWVCWPLVGVVWCSCGLALRALFTSCSGPTHNRLCFCVRHIKCLHMGNIANIVQKGLRLLYCFLWIRCGILMDNRERDSNETRRWCKHTFTQWIWGPEGHVSLCFSVSSVGILFCVLY